MTDFELTLHLGELPAPLVDDVLDTFDCITGTDHEGPFDAGTGTDRRQVGVANPVRAQ